MIGPENVFVLNKYKYKKQGCGGCQIISHSTFLKKVVQATRYILTLLIILQVDCYCC